MARRYDPDRWHRRSMRAPWHNYRRKQSVFVTICVQNRECLFGEIVEGVMRLNDYGRSVEQCWRAIEAHCPGVVLDAFVVMPNHLHGIVNLPDVAIAPLPSMPKPPIREVARGKNTGDHLGALLRGPLSGSLGAVIRAFKSASAKQINELRDTTGRAVWQRGYYDEITTDELVLNRVRTYIANNPARWIDDDLNPAMTGTSPRPSGR